MKRAAYWLAHVVGEGNRWEKAQLRAAIPGVEQIDRRVRDLRMFGWVIHNYRDRADLTGEEHLLVKIGDHVWEEDFQAPSTGVSATVRRRVFERDGNRCVVCGIGAGEEYPDWPGHFARLTIGHLTPTARRGKASMENLRTECALCNEPARHLTEAPVDVDLLLLRIRELPRRNRDELLEWARSGKRHFSDLERLWMQLRQVPVARRDEIVTVLEQLSGRQPPP